MDEAWVINQDMVTASKNSGVNIPIRVVPHATEFEKFEKSYKPIQLPCPEDDFVFYFVGELNPRKNIQALIRAFHLEFHKNEPTSLVLKVNGGNPESVANSVREMCHSIKSSMKIRQNPNQYKEDYINNCVLFYFSRTESMTLHNKHDKTIAVKNKNTFKLINENYEYTTIKKYMGEFKTFKELCKEINDNKN